jgi:trk/ktr system potassium uptake protein
VRIMVIGTGDIGMPIVHYLSETGNIVTVIEKDEKKCKHISDHADAAIFRGSGTNLRIWKSAEAEKADALFAVTNMDDINARVCEIAKKQFGIPFVVARARQPESMEKMREAGADVVICPSLETKRLFLNALESRSVETLYEKDSIGYKLAVVAVPSNGTIIGKTVQQLNLPENVRIATVFRNSSFEFPPQSFMFKGGDRVLLMGLKDETVKVAEKLRQVEVT